MLNNLSDEASRQRRNTHRLVGALARLPPRHHSHGILRRPDRHLPAAQQALQGAGVEEAGNPVLRPAVRRVHRRGRGPAGFGSDDRARRQPSQEIHPNAVPKLVRSFFPIAKSISETIRNR